jgi:hypothetical protein
MKFIEINVRKIATEQGYREAAKQLLDAYLGRKYGLSTSQLPESIEISGAIDDIESLLEDMIVHDSFQSDEFLYYLNDMFSDDTFHKMMFE